MSRDTKKLVTRGRAAELLGITVSGVRSLERRGLLQCVRNGSRALIDVAESQHEGLRGIVDLSPMNAEQRPREEQVSTKPALPSWADTHARLEWDAERAAACEVALARVQWRFARLAALLAEERHRWVWAGWPPELVQVAVSSAEQVLCCLSDEDLQGAIWPSWIAACAACDAVGVPRPVLPWIVVVDLAGCEVVRPIGPGD